MKNNTSLIYNVFLVVGDFLALVGAFSVAYILRVSISHQRIHTPIRAINYLDTFLILLPFFILLFALIGLYKREIYEHRFKELGRILIGSFIGVLFVISYGYVFNVKIFPARLVILYGYILALIFVVLFRNIVRQIRTILFRYDKGINNALIIGDNKLARQIINLLITPATSGYRIVGVVGSNKTPIKNLNNQLIFNTFDQAINKLGSNLHTIIQTEIYNDQTKNSQILTYAQEHHISYRYTPGNSELLIGNLEVEIFRGIPIIDVHQTALVGWGQIVKRTVDLILSLLILIICSPIMLITVIAELLSGDGSILFTQDRMTRFDQRFKVYKFRTQYQDLDGTTPEQAFLKLGKPELAKEYRKNGDVLVNDPRVTPLGHFLKWTSIDELPQLFNIIKGDISLVGPRALIPEEIAQYSKRHAILSVRSGLTGLAQVSGRRDITFDERRRLDLYYVQNWSFWGDFVILVKTVWVVIRHKGAA